MHATRNRERGRERGGPEIEQPRCVSGEEMRANPPRWAPIVRPPALAYLADV